VKARTHRPCSLVVSILATGEHGVALVQWGDGAYSIKLDAGVWVEAQPEELVFLRSIDRPKVTA
jgi:hypothetical protein